MLTLKRPRLWVTYAWSDDDRGDFSYLVQELRDTGIDATYDKIALIPGRLLWEQIGTQISSGQLDGWAYLLTKDSLASKPCQEELAYALYRAMNNEVSDFPLIGLVHGVEISDVPLVLKVRLCVSLASPHWKEQVLSGLESRPPNIASPAKSEFVWDFHDRYRGDVDLLAVEVCPRFSELMFWRFAVPTDALVDSWGFGPAGGLAFAAAGRMRYERSDVTLNNEKCTVFGSGDVLFPSISAYLVLRRPLPRFIAFGTSPEAYGLPSVWEITHG